MVFLDLEARRQEVWWEVPRSRPVCPGICILSGNWFHGGVDLDLDPGDLSRQSGAMFVGGAAGERRHDSWWGAGRVVCCVRYLVYFRAIFC